VHHLLADSDVDTLMSCIELYRFVVCPFHSEVRAPFGLRVTHGRISLSMRRLSPCRPTRFNARSISSLEEKFVHVLNHSRHVALELPPLPQDESEEHLNDAERWDPSTFFVLVWDVVPS
jgi:hypothetical protein